MWRRSIVLGSLVGAAALAGCAGPPALSAQAEVRSAEAAIRTARELGARDTPSAAPHLAAAEDAMMRGKRVLAASDEENAFPLFTRAEAEAALAGTLARNAAHDAERVRSGGDVAGPRVSSGLALGDTQKDESTSRPRAERGAKDVIAPLAAFGEVREERSEVTLVLPASTLFDGKSATLADSARPRLDRIATSLNDAAMRGAPVSVIGFAATGNKHDDETLSKKRSEAVVDYLTKAGVPADRLKAEGAGDDRSASRASATGRARNEA